MKTITDYTTLLKSYFANNEIIAPVEVSPSENAYSQGDKLVYNGTLYDVTSAIAVNDVLTVGTNIVASDDITTLIDGKANAATVLSQTLASGSTTVTFTGIPTVGDYLVSFYNTAGINHTALDVSTPGTAILTFDAQSGAVTVYCKIEEV